MQSSIYQFLSVYAVGILGYQEHQRNRKYVLIPSASRPTGIDREDRKGDNDEPDNRNDYITGDMFSGVLSLSRIGSLSIALH